MHSKLKYLSIIVVIVIYQGCSPFEGNQEGSVGLFSVSELKCSANDPRNPLQSSLKRLNRFELKNTIYDIFKSYLSVSELDQLVLVVDPIISAFPEDAAQGLKIGDQAVTLEHIDQQLLLSEGVSDFIINKKLLGKVAGACSSTASNIACRNQFLNDFGLKALRRPLSVEDIQHYNAVMDGDSQSYRNVIAALFSSPRFFYQTEFGSEDVGDENGSMVVSLDAYERASKISYFLLQSLPDAELFSAAADGSLLSQSGVKKQVDRLLKDPLVRKRLTYFFANQWLDLNETPEFRDDIAAVSTVLGELKDKTAIDKRRENLIQEVYDYFDYMIWEQKASFKELMASELVFPRTADLAEIYNTPVWNGSYDLASLVRAPAGQRAGLFTRAQFLFTGTGSTRSIMRGAHIYKKYMCGKLSLPDDNSNPEGVAITDDMTGKEYVQAITEMPGTSCVGCHQRILNPIGFSFENFDSFGRWRLNEKVYHPEDSIDKGKVLVVKPVVVESHIDLPGMIQLDAVKGSDTSLAVAQSSRAQACFSSNLWNFALKQNLGFGENGCAVGSLFQSLNDTNGSILNAIGELPLQPEFLKRTTK